jgi:hypothetical protein
LRAKKAALLRSVARSPLAWILFAILALRAVGLGWGLPASDGWDNDGVAPRDFLAGLVETVTPGHYFTYPPGHLALLALATAPITAVALARAPSLAQADVIARMLEVPTMTAIAIVARLVSLAMSIGVVWAVAKTAEELAGKRAGWWAAAFLGVNVPLTYYAHTTNLDVPYLFWGSLATLALVRAVARDEPRLLRRWAVLAAIAVTTKDQAYALFLLAAPATVALWATTFRSRPGSGKAGDLPSDRGRRGALRREAAVAVLLGAAIVVAVDGVLYNPAGFRARVRFLLGPASQAYAQYTSDTLGRWDVLRDMVGTLDHFYPWTLSAFALVGLVWLVRDSRARAGRLVAALVPLLVAVSFLVTFNCVARRTDERFALPQTAMLAVYGGIGLDAAFSRFRPAPARWLGRLAVVASLVWGLFEAAAVDVNLLCDPRYAAEAWLRDHLRPGDTVETYGLNVYMPRFPPGSRVIRVGPEASDHRNPMPGVEEVVDAYDNARGRGARYVVLSAGWGWRYLIDARAFPTQGRVLPTTQRQTAEDARATSYFQALVQSAYAPYRFVYGADFQSKIWPRVDLHASTAREIWIYERRPD